MSREVEGDFCSSVGLPYHFTWSRWGREDQERCQRLKSTQDARAAENQAALDGEHVDLSPFEAQEDLAGTRGSRSLPTLCRLLAWSSFLLNANAGGIDLPLDRGLGVDLGAGA
eukprot:7835885-Karenia_brevis.AAC.1